LSLAKVRRSCQVVADWRRMPGWRRGISNFRGIVLVPSNEGLEPRCRLILWYIYDTGIPKEGLRVKLFLSTAALLTLIGAPAFAAGICEVGTNLVQNCGFESGSLGPGWTGGNSVNPSGTFGIPSNSGGFYLSLGA